MRGAGHPAAIVLARQGFGLSAEFRWFAGQIQVIEQHGHDTQAVFLGQFEQLVHALEEFVGVRLPNDKLQRHADAGIAHVVRPAQLFINCVGVERVLRPHINRIDGGARDIVDAFQRFEAVVPIPDATVFPTPAGLAFAGARQGGGIDRGDGRADGRAGIGGQRAGIQLQQRRGRAEIGAQPFAIEIERVVNEGFEVSEIDVAHFKMVQVRVHEDAFGLQLGATAVRQGHARVLSGAQHSGLAALGRHG